MALQKKFDASSPGFLYSVIVAALTIFAATGVNLPGSPEQIGSDLVTTLSTGGIFALVGVIVSSVVFPLYNHFKDGGKFNLRDIFSRNLTWIALGNAAAAAIALTGFLLPAGTVEQIVGAVVAKDWMSLGSVLLLTVGNTILRWIKEKQQQAESAAR